MVEEGTTEHMFRRMDGQLYYSRANNLYPDGHNAPELIDPMSADGQAEIAGFGDTSGFSWDEGELN